MDNLTEVVDCIHDLSRHTLIQLGSTLGLSYVRLQRLTNPRGIILLIHLNMLSLICIIMHADIAQSWLQRDDHVLMTSGEPSWTSLVIALQRIGHPDVASCIIKKHESKGAISKSSHIMWKGKEYRHNYYATYDEH